MTHEFDLEALQALITRALENEGTTPLPQPEVVGSAPPVSPSPATGGALPLTLFQLGTFAKVGEILHTHLGDAQASAALIELRDYLNEGLERGSLRDLHAVTLACQRCADLEHPAALPEGNLARPDIVFVYGSPGKDQRELSELLVQLGWDLQRTAHSYAARCRSKAGPPTSTHVEHCRPYLHAELALLSPSLIVCCGKLALSAVLGTELPITQERGKIFWLGQWPVMATLSPTHAAQTPRNLESLTQDLQQAHRFVFGN